MLSIFKRILLLSPLFFYSFLSFFCYQSAAYAQSVKLKIDTVLFGGMQANQLLIHLDENGKEQSFKLNIGSLLIGNDKISPLSLECPQLNLKKTIAECKKGKLQIAKDEPIPLQLHYDTLTKHLKLLLVPKNEQWQINIKQDDKTQIWQVDIQLKNARLGRLLPYLKLPIKFTKGEANGKIFIKGQGKKILDIQSDLNLSDIQFSDEQGLHAGEKVGMHIEMRALGQNAQNTAWKVTGNVAWTQGEIFWQPVYLPKAGHRVQFNAAIQDNSIQVVNTTLSMDQIGKIELAKLELAHKQLKTLDLKTEKLPFKPLYLVFLQPFFASGLLAKLDPQSITGEVQANIKVANGLPQTFDLFVNNLSFRDAEKRFRLEALNVTVPWRNGQQNQAIISLTKGRWRKLPFGPVYAEVEFNQKQQRDDIDFAISHIDVPILDGILKINDFHGNVMLAENQEPKWDWKFGAQMDALSMQKLSKAMEIPMMQGTLSATIPEIHYENHDVHLDGHMDFDVFNGKIIVDKMRIYEPFGKTSRLEVNMTMREIDLDALTRTFSFGSMQGKIDADILNVELNNWKPVAFNARVTSSPGSYPRKISQKAVQNISSLGGDGAVAAIQRSALGFFENFGYDKIGFGCELKYNICRMTGINEATENGYLLIKGAGIPAINVVGFNRFVDWQDFLERLTNVIQNSGGEVVVK